MSCVILVKEASAAFRSEAQIPVDQGRKGGEEVESSIGKCCLLFPETYL